MKKILPIFVAIIIGSVCAYILFQDVDGRTYKSEDTNATALQIGVFTKKENALDMARNYGGIVIDDSGVFRVYLGILHNKSNIEFIENYLNNNGISYYTKKVLIDKEYLTKGNMYEKLMDKSNDYNVKLKTNKELLKYYEGVL